MSVLLSPHFSISMVCFILSLKKLLPRILLHGSRDRVISVSTSFNCGKDDRGLDALGRTKTCGLNGENKIKALPFALQKTRL